MKKTQLFELSYPGDVVRYLTLIGDADVDAEIKRGGHAEGLLRVRPISPDEVRPAPASVPVPREELPPAFIEIADQRVADLLRQNQILAQAIDDLRQEVNRRFQAQADHMNRIASEAIITPELRQGAA